MAEIASLRADEWEVRTCTHADAVALIESAHYAGGASNTSTVRHGLYRKGDGTLWGVALWIPPTRNAASSVSSDPDGVLALSRLCVLEGAPKNAASYLLGASMRMIDRGRWHTLLTYADTRQGHTGAIYRATNWTYLGEVPGSDSWVHSETGEQRGRKRGGRTLKAAEMREAGFVRVPPMPKHKFVHITTTRKMKEEK